MTLSQLRFYEIDSQALFCNELGWSVRLAFFGRWSFATIRAIERHTVFISLKPSQGNWQKKDPAKEPGQKP
ncbi:hypothetical protein PUN49_13845 [Pseudomonas extremaustralis]|jgi:hypothetical protein|uniref:hypothetical protein n=1 Tax=Pseudomonas TaxID=286 RepID=UPI00099C1868|nr:hypothetical protein [Pseudomonas extremaustralis]MDG2968117.1 hypothetical protein [Pseudomonas extremaustralis]MDY7067140.1 hypothetical protein [Pseudomonas extremaustralis]UUJ40251.1 hypothetical protein L1A22_26835 [Pseudomonas extremaustralis]